ncbi:hypothetical protein BS78_06G227600 [Paspalum vaginatum]|nr:hypothetical protein BS78_06G227600 [Paspalum vaginatum]KAJ1272771.1 hypothetical protein BS78_06G227600 [Paspalum vaginatum]
MAREEELKRIDLKVNVSCCEGCRRKVMKAMSLKGVLRTEIQPSHDRVTVVGDVDAKVLVKKLAKIGKIAEVLPAAAPSEDGKKRDDGGNNRKDGDRAAPPEERSRGKDDGGKCSAGDKAKAAGKQECKKCAHEAARADGDHADAKAPPTKGGAAGAKSIEEGGDAADGDGEGLSTKSLAPDGHAAPQPPLQMQQHYHLAEPPMAVPVHMPAYYAAPYYGMPPPVRMPVPPMGQLRAQPSRFDEDFFNDDNAVGCRVM